MESEQNIKAAISTVLLHALLFLVCFFFYIQVQIPVEEIEQGGIVINYGTSETGMGTDIRSVDEPAIGEQISNEPVVDPNRPNSPTDASSSEKDVLTQDFEEAPSVQDKNPNSSNSTTNISTETKTEPAKPSVDQRAIFKGKRNNGTGGGDGTGSTPGNQGAINGDPNSDSYTGSGGTGGGNGIALNLAGRKFLTLPKIQDDGQTQGKISVDITVDKSGTIVTAKAGGRGTTISNNQLWQKCERAVLGVKLNAISSGPEIQAGSVVFTFILE